MRSLAVSPCGKYLASGDESHNLVIWNTNTSKIVRKYKLCNAVIDNLAWNPKTTSCILAACNENIVYII